jgi:hypothetical protein
MSPPRYMSYAENARDQNQGVGARNGYDTTPIEWPEGQVSEAARQSYQEGSASKKVLRKGNVFVLKRVETRMEEGEDDEDEEEEEDDEDEEEEEDDEDGDEAMEEAREEGED